MAATLVVSAAHAEEHQHMSAWLWVAGIAIAAALLAAVVIARRRTNRKDF